MNHKESRTKALESIKVASMKKEAAQMHINQHHDIVHKIHQAAIDHKHTPVTELLKKINVPYSHYLTLCKTHLSIPNIRQDVFGASRILTQAQKNTLSARLLSSKNKKAAAGVKPRKRSKSKSGRHYSEYAGDGVEDLDAKIYKAAAGVAF